MNVNTGERKLWKKYSKLLITVKNAKQVKNCEFKKVVENESC